MENAPTMTQQGTDVTYRTVRRHHRAIVGPIVLISLGLVFLGQNVGLLPGDTWLSLWQLWPLLLVLAGVELIFGRSRWGATIASLLFAFVVLALVASLTFLAPVIHLGNGGTLSSGSFGPTVVDRMSQDLGDTRHATIDLQHGAGRLVVEALPAASTQLIDAELGHSQNTTIQRSVEGQNGDTNVRLRGQTQWNGFSAGEGFREDWTVRLSPKVPTNLQIHSGASAVNLDLADLVVTDLSVESGASSVNLTLPRAAGLTNAHIKTGAAGVEVTVPDGVAARIKNQGGLSDTAIDQSRFQLSGGYYQSPDYDTAANRIDLSIQSGVSGVTVH